MLENEITIESEMDAEDAWLLRRIEELDDERFEEWWDNMGCAVGYEEEWDDEEEWM